MTDARQTTAPAQLPPGYDCSCSPAAPDRAAAAWDRLRPTGPAGFYLSHQWLTSLRGTKGYQDHTWSIRDCEGRLAGLVPVYTSPQPVDIQLYDLFALFGRWGPAPRQAWAPQVLIGSRSGYINAPMLTDRSLLPAWAAVAARAAAQPGTGSAAIPYLEAALARELSALLPASVALLSGGTGRIDLTAADLEAYLAGLPRSRRRIIRADMRMFARSGRRISTGRMDPSLAGRLAPLLASVQHRHGSTVPVGQVADYLRSCAAPGLAERSVLFVCWDASVPVGFSLAFEAGSSLSIRVVGLDYERTGQHAEYFTLLVHEPVRYALGRGLATVDLGAEGYRAKLLRGARFVPLWTLLLASPIPWPPETVRAHNAERLAEMSGSFGDLVTDTAALASLGPG